MANSLQRADVDIGGKVPLRRSKNLRDFHHPRQILLRPGSMETLGNCRPHMRRFLGDIFLLTEGKASFFRYLPPFSASVYRLFLHLTACCFSGPKVEVIRISFIRLLRRSMSRPTTPEVSRRRWVLKTTIIAPSKACAARPGWCCQLFLFADEVFPTQFKKIYILSVFVSTPDGQKDCASGPHRIEPFMGWVG